MSDHANLYQKLIEAARDTLDATGQLPDSLEVLAARTGADPASVRACFASVAALREGVIWHATTLLNDAVRRGVIESGGQSPDAQLRALVYSYADWADRNPALFRLIAHGLTGPLETDSTLYRFGLSMRELFERKLKQMRDLGMIRDDCAMESLLLLVHCTVAGANMLFATRDSDPWLRDDPRPSPLLAADIFDTLLRTLAVPQAPDAPAGARPKSGARAARPPARPDPR